MTSAKLLTRSRLEGLAILALAAGYVWETRKIPSLFQSPGVPGPAAFPTVLGAVLALAGLWRLVRGSLADRVAQAREAREAGAPTSWLAAHGRFYALWAVLLGFLAFLPELGFPAGAFLALALMFRLLDEKRWQVIIPLSLAVTAVLHVAFAYGLGVRLPLGLLQGLLRR
jgi:hypothetical protein